jgi:hypothetical protein
MTRKIRRWRSRPAGQRRRRRHLPAAAPRGWPAEPRRAAARRRRRVLATAAVFVAVLAGALGGVQLIPTRYAATSVVSFVPRPNSQTPADTVQLVGQKYVVLATSPITLDAAGRAVRAPLGLLTGATTAVLGAGTGNVAVTVTLPDRFDAAAAANAVAVTLVQASRDDRLVAGEQTAPAVPATAEARPPRTLLRGAGGLAALLASALTWSALAGLSRPREAPRDGVTVAIR